jgi:hypothetical protein
MAVNKKIILIFLIIILILAVFLTLMGVSRIRQSADADGQETEAAMQPAIDDVAEEEEPVQDDTDGIVLEEPEIIEASPRVLPRIGASAVTEPSRLTTDVAVVEARYMTGRDQNFWNVVDICLAHDLYLIANIIIGNTADGQLLSESEWRTRVEEITSELLRRGATRETARMTIDNEPMKYLTREEYINYVNIAYDQIGRRFDVGAGNEEYDLAMRSDNMYEYLAENAVFDVLDIHIQSSMTTPESIHEKGNWFRDLAHRYNKRLSVTEANWFDVSTPEGYNMLIMQLEKAMEIGAEDFSVVFVSLQDRSAYEWLSFIYNGQIRNEENWHDFRQRMIESKNGT